MLAESGAGLGEALPQDLASHFDLQLARQNSEYQAKRDSQRLGLPEVWIVAAGSYARLRRERQAQGANQSQIKTPKLTRDPEFADGFDVQQRI